YMRSTLLIQSATRRKHASHQWSRPACNTAVKHPIQPFPFRITDDAGVVCIAAPILPRCYPRSNSDRGTRLPSCLGLEVRDLSNAAIAIYVLTLLLTVLVGVALEHFFLIRPLEARAKARAEELVQAKAAEAERIREDAGKILESSKRQAL